MAVPGPLRRWNGWGDPAVAEELTPYATELLPTLVGPATPPVDATLASVAASLPASRLENRARPVHGRRRPGPSCPRPEPARLDRPALRTDRGGARRGRPPDQRGRGPRSAGPCPEPRLGAHPLWRRHERGRRRDADRRGPPGRLGGPGRAGRPYGFRTRERPGHLRGRARPGRPWKPPSARMASPWATSRSRSNTRRSAAGSPRGRRASNRSASDASSGCSPAVTSRPRPGRWTSPPFPASAAGPDLRELVLGSEGRLGILTDAVVRAVRRPRRDQVPRLLRCPTGSTRSVSPGRWPRRALPCPWSACPRRSRRRPRWR